jgi:hypothetical protein
VKVPMDRRLALSDAQLWHPKSPEVRTTIKKQLRRMDCQEQQGQSRNSNGARTDELPKTFRNLSRDSWLGSYTSIRLLEQ